MVVTHSYTPTYARARALCCDYVRAERAPRVHGVHEGPWSMLGMHVAHFRPMCPCASPPGRISVSASACAPLSEPYYVPHVPTRFDVWSSRGGKPERTLGEHPQVLIGCLYTFRPPVWLNANERGPALSASWWNGPGATITISWAVSLTLCKAITLFFSRGLSADFRRAELALGRGRQKAKRTRWRLYKIKYGVLCSSACFPLGNPKRAPSQNSKPPLV